MWQYGHVSSYLKQLARGPRAPTAPSAPGEESAGGAARPQSKSIAPPKEPYRGMTSDELLKVSFGLAPPNEACRECMYDQASP
jgi:hypothetical protein